MSIMWVMWALPFLLLYFLIFSVTMKSISTKCCMMVSNYSTAIFSHRFGNLFVSFSWWEWRPKWYSMKIKVCPVVWYYLGWPCFKVTGLLLKPLALASKSVNQIKSSQIISQRIKCVISMLAPAPKNKFVGYSSLTFLAFYPWS